MHTATNSRLKVISYPELVGIFAAFIAVFWLLFPKSMIEQQILNETTNYDLTVAYLENMLRLEPENESMMTALAETAIHSGKYDLAQRLLGVLLHSHQPQTRAKAFWLEYHIFKDSPRDDTTPDVRLARLRSILTDALAEGMIAPAFLQEWYGEALWLDDKAAALQLTTLALQTAPHHLYWLQQRYALALTLHRSREALQSAQALAEADPARRETWLSDAYYLALDLHDDAVAETTLLQLEPYGMQWREALASFALEHKQYRQASERYRAIARTARVLSLRRRADQMALNALQAGGRIAEALALAKRYETPYLNDPTMTTFLLKFYLGTGELDAAAAYAHRLLQERETE